jgi:hypothetical protein
MVSHKIFYSSFLDQTPVFFNVKLIKLLEVVRPILMFWWIQILIKDGQWFEIVDL